MGFCTDDNSDVVNAFYVKSVEEIPYNISIIQITKALPSAAAEAPTPAPSQLNLTDKMSAHGCKVFADTLLSNHEAMATYQDNIEGGVTVFCPLDEPMKAFLPKFKNLTSAGKASFLEFYGVPIYQTMDMLRSNNGLMNTLATDGANKFDFTVQNDGQDVTLMTKVNTVKITGTLLDQDSVAVYSLDKVLMPKELFKAAITPAPAPAPAPKGGKAKKGKAKAAPTPKSEASADSPADGPVGDAADATADGNGVGRFEVGWFVSGGLSMVLGFMLI